MIRRYQPMKPSRGTVIPTEISVCARCQRRRATGTVPIYASVPLKSTRQKVDFLGRPVLRVEWLNDLPFPVVRDEPWCVPCGRNALQGAGEYVWLGAGS